MLESDNGFYIMSDTEQNVSLDAMQTMRTTTISPPTTSSFDNDITMPGRRERKPDGRFEPGDLILGRYKVVSQLGQGGMGVVYKCFVG